MSDPTRLEDRDLTMDGMADPHAAVLDAATRRLAADPDLRLEVRQELRGHLDDAAAEYEAAGFATTEAAAKAAEAFGNAAALADELYAANRGRLRRRAAARWAFRLTVVPAAAVACLTVAGGVVTTLAAFHALSERPAASTGGSPPQASVAQGLVAAAWDRTLARAAPDDRPLLRPSWDGPSGRWLPAAQAEARVAAAQALFDRSPDDPVLHAHLVAESLRLPGLDPDAPGGLDPAALAAHVARLDRGAALEPGNGFYPLLKAAALLTASATLRQSPGPGLWPGNFEDPQPGGWPAKRYTEGVGVTDPATFARGLAAFREAAGRPAIYSHAADLTDRRVRAFPPVRGLADYLLLMNVELRADTYYLGWYARAARRAGGHAVALAAAGDVAGAEAVVAADRRVGLLVSAGARSVHEALVGQSLQAGADTYQAVAYCAAGRVPEFETALARLREREGAWETFRAELRPWEIGRRQMGQFAGIVQGSTFPARGVPDDVDHLDRVDLEPGRRAEYAVADQFGLSVLAGAFLLAGAAVAGRLVSVKASRRRRPRPDDDVPFSLGPWRLAAIVLTAGALPAAGYLLLANLTPLGARGRSVAWTWPQLAMEYVALAALLSVTARLAVDRAVATRAKSLGASLALPPARFRFRTTALVTLMVILGGLTLLNWAEQRPQNPAALWAAWPMTALLLATTAVLSSARERFRRRASLPGGSAVVATGNASRGMPLWERPIRGSLAVPLALAAGVCLLLTVPGPGKWPVGGPVRTYGASGFAACTAALLLTGLTWATGRVRRWWKPAAPVPSTDAVSSGRPVVSWRVAAARPTAAALAAIALVVGVAGAAVLRWEEDRLVGRFGQAGYDSARSLDRTAYAALRDRAAKELAADRPATRPGAAGG